MAKTMMPQNRRTRRRSKKIKQEARGRGVQHELIDPMTALMIKTNYFICAKVLEDITERVENGK